MSTNDDRGPGFRAFLIVMTVIMVVALVLRFISRTMLPKSARNYENSLIWWDDYVALAATCAQIALFAMEFAMIDAGFGRHMMTLDMDKILFLSKMNWAGNFVYDIALFLSKIAALLFLARVFPRASNSKWFNYALWTTFGLNVAWLFGIVFGTIFFCWPISKNWLVTQPGNCGTQFDLLVGSAVPSVVIDLIILVLPLPKLWHLRIDRAKKVGLMAVFILGYCVIIVSLGRLITVTTQLDAVAADFTHALIPTYYWVSAEVPVTIISISLPAMLPLGRHLSNNYFTPLASLVSSLVASEGRASRSRSNTTDPKHFDLEPPQYPNGIRLASRDGPRSFAKSPSVESSEQSMLGPESYAAQVQYARGNHGHSHEIPRGAIRVDNQVTINRQGN